jgi:hypothetical protein
MHRYDDPAFEAAFKGKFANKEMAYETHRDFFAGIKLANFMVWRACTHACRGSGARFLHAQGYERLGPDALSVMA